MFMLPPFNKEDPRQWFEQVERAFATANITDTKVSYVTLERDRRDMYLCFLANVDKQVLDLLPETLKNDPKRNPPPTDDVNHVYYVDIKKEILRLFDVLGKKLFQKLFKDDHPINPKASTPSTILKLPKSSLTNVATWFTQIETIFSLENITAEREKCLQLITNLEPEIISLIKDILPTENYANIKEKLHVLSVTERISAVCKSLNNHVSAIEKEVNEVLTKFPKGQKVAELTTNIENLTEMNAAAEKRLDDLKKKLKNSLQDKSNDKTLQLVAFKRHPIKQEVDDDSTDVTATLKKLKTEPL